MAELLKDKMIAETVNLLVKYLEVHNQIFEASVSVQRKITIIIYQKDTGQIYKWFPIIIKFSNTNKQKCFKRSINT